MSIENQISMFNENGKIVHKIWNNNAWHDLNVASAASVSGFKEYGTGLHVFEVPAGVTQLTVSGTAAGAGGHSGFNYNKQRAGWGGGSGEWVHNQDITVTPGEHIAISVGRGGNGSSRAYLPGEDGENTIIGKYFVLKGGNDNNSGGAVNGGVMERDSNGVDGLDSSINKVINTGAGGGSNVYSDYDYLKLTGGKGGDNATMNTFGGAGGAVTSAKGAGGSGGGAGYGGYGGAGGSCDSTQAGAKFGHHESYDGDDAQGYGAGGGGGANYGVDNFAWGFGGKGGDGFVRIEWTV